MLNTTFTFPSFDIVSATQLPPDPKAPNGTFFSSAELVTKMGEPFIMGPPSYWGNLLSEPATPDSNVTFYDLFMDAVIWGKDGVPAAELVGRANEQRLLQRVDDVYGLIMAQLYSSQARISPSTQSPKVGKAVVTSDQYRVVQSIAATRILEGVLGAMLLCCIGVYLLLSTKELLPQNPCTIGAAASYVAGSKLCEKDDLLREVELSAGSKAKGYEVLEGHRFGFGWYSKNNERRYGVFTRKGKEETILKDRKASTKKSLRGSFKRLSHPSATPHALS